MTEWLYHLPVVWMALVVFAVTSLVTGVIYGAVLALATGERARAFKAVSPVMLTPLAVVFGLLIWVKWTVVILLAVLILLTIAIVHSDNRATAAIAMAIFAIGVAACAVLIASHNRPFTGEISVGPGLLLQVMPEE